MTQIRSAGGVSQALRFRELFDTAPVLQLLRADHAPLIIALLHSHLGGEQRELEAPVLHDLIDADLTELRLIGLPMPSAAQKYCSDWVRAGYLQRRAGAQRGVELYSLSDATFTAHRFLDGLARPRGAATQSRLTLLTDHLSRLIRDTDPLSQNRVAALEEERDRLTKEIELAAAGEYSPLANEQAIESVKEIYALALDVPADFARVRAAIEDLHRQLRLDLIENEGPQGDVLEQLFLGVDKIDESEAGRSFTAFHRMLLDATREAEFNDAVDTLATRDFARTLDPEIALFLQTYIRRLQREAHEVRTTMVSLSRSLREFVQSRQLEEYRALVERLRVAKRTGVEVAQKVRAHHRIGLELQLTTFTPRSVGQIRLHSPQDVTVSDQILEAAPEVLDLEALRAAVRETEIDMEELVTSVNDTLAHARSTAPTPPGQETHAQPPVTLAEVLEYRPATQGLASLVGLLALGSRHGEPGAPCTVQWQRKNGALVQARVDGVVFREEIRAW